MKMFRRAAVLLLALSMLFAMAPAALAAETDASETPSEERLSAAPDAAAGLNAPEYVPAAPYTGGVSVMTITSGDPAGKGRLWVEAEKGNKASGQLTLTGPDGARIYSGDLAQIKGRGNSTWALEKKPYQIKLASKCQLAEGAGAAKTWVLLASYCDPSFIRTAAAFDLAEALGVDYVPAARWVELYYDGEYRGLYILCEKVEVGSARVDIPDADAAVEAANLENPAYASPETRCMTLENGARFQYVAGLTEPAAPEELGCLLELEFSDRYEEEQSWLVTARGQALVIKNPEYLTRASGEFIASLWQDFEDAVYSENGFNARTGRYYYEYCGLDSLVRVYLAEELTKNQDGFLSSTYFYYDPADGMLRAGPVWDFDLSLGAGDGEELISAQPQGLQSGGQYLCAALYRLESFRKALSDVLGSDACQGALDTLLAGEDVSGSIMWYASLLEEAAARDAALWGAAPYAPTSARAGGTPAGLKGAAEYLAGFLDQRRQWMEGFAESGVEQYLKYGFWDVSDADWFASSVERAASAGLFSGYAPAMFNPGGSCTRAMLATALYRLAGSPQTAAAPAPADVSPADWYGAAALWAWQTGVVTGDGESFSGGAALTRAEAAVMLYRFALYTGGAKAGENSPDAAKFADGDTVPGWALEAAGFCADMGVITGDENGCFAPGGQTTRAQLAAMLTRYMENVK